MNFLSYRYKNNIKKAQDQKFLCFQVLFGLLYYNQKVTKGLIIFFIFNLR